MRITRVVTSVIEIVEEEPGPMSIRQSWLALASPPPPSDGAGRALGAGLLSARREPSSTVAVGAAVVGVASAAAAILSNEEVRRRVAVGAVRARSALRGVRVEAWRRAASLRGDPRPPRALPAPAASVTPPNGASHAEPPAPRAMA